MSLAPVRMIYPYYENPKMLEKQVENWNKYQGELRDAVQLLIIDDGSPKNPAKPILEKCFANRKLFRIEENIPWNQHGARNLGAKVAKDDNLWLFMSDMDIIMPPDMMKKLLSKDLSEDFHYTFERRFLPDMVEEKYHCNTFMVKRKKYWEIGGYDEDYCGTYGGDGPFLRQLETVAPRRHLDDIILQGVKETVIEDANTREWDRYGDMKVAYRKKFSEKRSRPDGEKSINPIRFKWERQL